MALFLSASPLVIHGLEKLLWLCRNGNEVFIEQDSVGICKCEGISLDPVRIVGGANDEVFKVGLVVSHTVHNLKVHTPFAPLPSSVPDLAFPLSTGLPTTQIPPENLPAPLPGQRTACLPKKRLFAPFPLWEE